MLDIHEIAAYSFDMDFSFPLLTKFNYISYKIRTQAQKYLHLR